MTPSIAPMTILFLALVPAACKTFSEFRSSSKEDVGRGFAIVPKTIVPPEMLVNATRIQKNSPNPTIIEPIQVAPGLLLLSEIIRPRAYLRQGPGTHYEVGDQILAKGSRVIVQAQVGIWKKVQVMADGRVGWLHSKSVSDPVLNKSFIRVESKSLPTKGDCIFLSSYEPRGHFSLASPNTIGALALKKGCKMRKLGAPLLPLTLIIVNSLLASCAPTLSGLIKSSEGSLVVSQESRINITSLSLSTERHMATLNVQRDGSFSTRENLPAGDYLVEALVPGYAVSSKRVKIGSKEQVTLMLQPSTVLKTPSIGVNARLDQGRGAGGATLMPPSL
jgi:uncharacterized protein YgiM (DUF1202 family)